MNELALFAGAGGGLLASRWLLGWRTVCAVEREPYRQAVLLARQKDGCLDSFPIWSDVRDFDGRPWRGSVDVVTAGFPCQPFSVAGKRRGADDERNGWPDTIRIIREVGPRYALLENVPGLLNHEYARTIFGDLAEAGFDAEWTVLGADDCGAPHRRKRLWILAYASEGVIGWRLEQSQCGEAAGYVAHAGLQHEQLQQRSTGDEFARGGPDVAEPADARLAERWTLPVRSPSEVSQPSGNGAEISDARQRRRERTRCEISGWTEQAWWDAEPDVGRVADGVAARVDRLAALGDGQVPSVAARAWCELYGRIT